MRRMYLIGVVVIAALTNGGARQARDSPAATPRVWTGTWESTIGAVPRHRRRSHAEIPLLYLEGATIRRTAVCVAGAA